ncbi:MAG: penicillin acylase family protein [Rhodothermaceae bacterium]|nr:penicillin acylase family protein [Rhodothermaceae bacterium]MYI84437.1 penicillin acylase family protein [Rhodothermaceae bacterium]
MKRSLMGSNANRRVLLNSALRAILTAALLWGLHYAPSGIAPLVNLLDPVRGLYHNARIAEHTSLDEVVISTLSGPVTVERDERGVPHIFANEDKDAILALGYVTAQDRLFQMDFISRVAAGRLSEIFGPASLDADRFLRSTGMNGAAKQIMAAFAEEGGLDYEIMTWYADGVNAYLSELSYAEWPLEFKLFDYAPEPYTPMHTVLLMQYFNYDLSFNSEEAAYGLARERLGANEYSKLYPRHATRYKPIIPAEVEESAVSVNSDEPSVPSSDALALLSNVHQTLRKHGLEGHLPSKGSNNWAVTGDRSSTGSPILAGDMHLALSLPSIWYEVHLVTPSMNTYGVLAPGAPLPIEAFNDHVAWAYTNSGLDAMDHYLLQLNEDRSSYRFDGQWRSLKMQPDTIYVKNTAPVIDTLILSDIGPVIIDSTAAVAIRWVAHEKNNGMTALWDMNRAENAAQFDSALRHWHSPAMNVLYADTTGVIGIRVSGKLPIRASGDGVGLLDGSTSGTAWVGQVPFEEMPHATNPVRGYLTSTNQQPTTADYPYYVDHNWQPAYRSLRIDALLAGRDLHTVENMKEYQADFHVGQYDAFVPLLDSVRALTQAGEAVRTALIEWDGKAVGETPGPLALHEYLEALKRLTWDESLFLGIPYPTETVLVTLLETGSPWLDIQSTLEVEDAAMLMALALEGAADVLQAQYGDDWSWDKHHQVIFRHLTQNAALSVLWRGPYSYPGYDETLGPGDGITVTHSASWRVVVDFDTDPPSGVGIYAGGQNGNPLSRYYDLHIPTFLNFDYYPLHKPRKAGELAIVSALLQLHHSE